MCWSYNVSIAFASIEAAIIAFILVRSRFSIDPFLRKQWLLVPGLTSIWAMEVVEAMLWSRPEELISVRDTIDPSVACARFNQRLTVFIWLAILPWQPLWVIIPCRRVGHKDNRLLLQVPEFLAVVSAVAHIFFYMVSKSDRTLADSNFKSYLHSETCTYLGISGHHLHWTLSTQDSYFAPNLFVYILLWLSVVYARPKRFAAGILLFSLTVFAIQLLYFDMSFEAASVWCWLSMIKFVYFAIQPYVLPCTTSSATNEPAEKDLSNLKKPLLKVAATT
jgi:hypothetical protein